ncbi:arsenate reductase ArsC [Pedobacter sp. KR3-3]|uniref:Arsenate reductase ArsC n=1 Tax=Pedobacter albus TaxID=3113905 RepID=A0ABU7ICA8_9SPHI|nr:arsenate reductase ArsC [Pedobacter sp. KR3-3]MEE1947098.1 arsenate reductase ArsC [Pedobacter sp. KR3-3]
MKKILVLCTGNSCRSQMAEGYLRFFAKEKATIYSAGIETHGLNPKAVIAMKADGVDISSHTSNHIDEYRNIDFDFVITVCDHAQANCPFFPSHAKRFHQSFSDPAKAKGDDTEVLVAFIKTRDEIKAYCQEFIKENLD